MLYHGAITVNNGLQVGLQYAHSGFIIVKGDRSLMHDESSTVLDRIPLELPLHGVNSFNEDTFV